MFKVISRQIFAALLLAAVFAAAAFAPALAATPAPAGGPTAYVNTGRLNVRTGPGIRYDVVTMIDQGQTMTLLGRNQPATWVKVHLPNGTEGWVSAYYIRASVTISSLPVVDAPATPLSAAVTVSALELRAGPGPNYGLLATLGQGQTMSLLGRTSDSAWVKVSVPGKGEGWVPAQVIVRLPGAENGLATTPFQASVPLSSLAVVATPAAPRVTLSISSVRPASPVYVTLEAFPANRDVVVVLSSALVPNGFSVAYGRTDANGGAQLYFRMPDTWPSGTAIAETSLNLAVVATDGSATVVSPLQYTK